jgi:DDE superfamily endonuclease
MFAFVSEIPSRVRNVLSRFKRFFTTRPQYDNFCRAVLGMIVTGKKEHDVKSINELFINRKDQSSLNRFFTESRWSTEDVIRGGNELVISEGTLSRSIEYKILDDTVCRKYSPRTEMVCYNHSSTMGTVLSHDYVTSLYVNGSVSFQDGLKLYGSEKKCKEKRIDFKTKVQLACELIDEHKPRAKRTIWLWDSWYTMYDIVTRCRAHGYNWIGEMRNNRIAFYESKKYHLHELVEKLLKEGRFHDVVIDDEIYQACKVDAFVPKLGNVSIVINCRAGTEDVHVLCTDLMDCSTVEIVRHALKRGKVDQFYKEAKFLGLGEYRFRESEAALIHAHLVSLSHALLDVLRRRLLRYGITCRLLTLEGTVEWVRRKTANPMLRRVDMG